MIVMLCVLAAAALVGLPIYIWETICTHRHLRQRIGLR